MQCNYYRGELSCQGRCNNPYQQVLSTTGAVLVTTHFNKRICCYPFLPSLFSELCVLTSFDHLLYLVTIIIIVYLFSQFVLVS